MITGMLSFFLMLFLKLEMFLKGLILRFGTFGWKHSSLGSADKPKLIFFVWKYICFN